MSPAKYDHWGGNAAPFCNGPPPLRSFDWSDTPEAVDLDAAFLASSILDENGVSQEPTRLGFENVMPEDVLSNLGLWPD